MKTARFLAQLPGWVADARLYEVDPPMVWTEWDLESASQIEHPAGLVIVSATDVPFTGPETYIFPAKRVGDEAELADWCELDGSFRGGMDHVEALRRAGYEVE